jgi:hypothetical protein
MRIFGSTACMVLVAVAMSACGGTPDESKSPAAGAPPSATPPAETPRPAAPVTIPPPPPGVVAGIVFEDGNRNGILDESDVRAAGRTVLVTNPSATKRIQSATTDSDGQFKFAGLPAGEYRVSLQFSDGFVRTNDDSFTVKVAANTALPAIQFGMVRP